MIDLPEPVQRPNADAVFLHAVAMRMAGAAAGEALKEVVECAASVARADACFVYLIEGSELVLRASKTPHHEAVNRFKIKLGQSISGWIAEHREPVVISQHASQDHRSQRFNQWSEDNFDGFLSAPVLSRGRIVGVLNLHHVAPHAYSDREITLVSAIALLAGAEIEQVRLERENFQLLGKLETRTFVERAKGILQRDLKMSEEDAYRIMQRESQQRRKSMREIAEAVIVSDELKTSRSSGKSAIQEIRKNVS